MSATQVQQLVDYVYQTQRVTGSDGSEPVFQYVRLNPQAVSLQYNGTTNSAPDPTAGLLLQDYAHVSRKRAIGVSARLIRIARYVGTVPNLVELRRAIVILTPDLFYQIISAVGGTFSYQSQTDWTLIGNRPESYRFGRSSPVSSSSAIASPNVTQISMEDPLGSEKIFYKSRDGWLPLE